MTESVIIHGNEWKLDDIREEIASCRERIWKKERWHPTPALVHKKGGRTSWYRGQKYDPEKIDYVENGWSHDHCAICWFTLHDSNNDEESTGWTGENKNWLCQECYGKFIAKDKDNAEPSPEPYR